MTAQPQHSQLPVLGFFARFASDYPHQTGHSTIHILADIITDDVQTSAHPIGPDSVVHDNAAGPGAGVAALVSRIPADKLPREMLVSDSVAEMVSAASEFLTAAQMPHVECKKLDSHDLSSVPDDHFTHSIVNFSIFTFSGPVDAIREVHRTLRPNGVAIVTCWRRFPPLLIVRAAQKKIRPDLPLMPAPGPEFYEEGVLQKVVEESGFAHDKITMTEKVLVITDNEDIAGLTMFMTGPLMAKARNEYSKAEEEKWADSVKQAVKEEVESFGGIRFEAYVLLATK